MRSDEGLEVLSLMVQVVSGVGGRAAQRLERHGLTTVDLDVLVALGGPAAGGRAAGEVAADETAPGEAQPTMTDVAARTGLTPSGATPGRRPAGRARAGGPVRVRHRPAHHPRVPDRGGPAAARRRPPDHLDVVEAALLRPLRGTGQVAAFTGQLRLLRDALVEGEPSAVGAA